MDCSFVTVDSDILGETPVFTGSRVPIRVLFEHLKAGDSLEAFLQDFPSVSRALAIHALEDARRAVTPGAHDVHLTARPFGLSLSKPSHTLRQARDERA